MIFEGDCREEEPSDINLELQTKGPYISKDWKCDFWPKFFCFFWTGYAVTSL